MVKGRRAGSDQLVGPQVFAPGRIAILLRYTGPAVTGRARTPFWSDRIPRVGQRVAGREGLRLAVARVARGPLRRDREGTLFVYITAHLDAAA